MDRPPSIDRTDWAFMQGHFDQEDTVNEDDIIEAAALALENGEDVEAAACAAAEAAIEGAV